MTPAEKFLLVVQVISTSVIALTLIVYYFQFRIMRSQLKISEKAVQAQNTLSLINFLQDDETWQAKKTVITKLKDNPYLNWQEDEEKAASKVCSTYDIAGMIISGEMVSKKLFLENWGSSIKRCYEILEPHIKELQRPEKAGSEHWKHVKWLYEEANKKKICDY